MKLVEWPSSLVRDWMNHRIIGEYANKNFSYEILSNIIKSWGVKNMFSVAVQSSVLLSEAKKFCYLLAIGKHLCD